VIVASLVLVIEDNAEMRETLCQLLEIEGYIAIGAEHGQHAQQLMKTVRPLPSLILLDVQMPVMDGETFLRTLPNTGIEGVADIPVLAVTASPLQLDSVVGTIRKPFGLAQLLEAVRHYAA
jgi:CheY-like chemotaxis protein